VFLTLHGLFTVHRKKAFRYLVRDIPGLGTGISKSFFYGVDPFILWLDHVFSRINYLFRYNKLLFFICVDVYFYIGDAEILILECNSNYSPSHAQSDNTVKSALFIRL
jgi:hypothetical protein